MATKVVRATEETVGTTGEIMEEDFHEDR